MTARERQLLHEVQHLRRQRAVLGAVVVIAFLAGCLRGEAETADTARAGHEEAHSEALGEPISPAEGPTFDFSRGHARTTAPTADLLPRDPFRRAATKALRGDFGPLADWQRCAYEWGLARGVTVCGTATVTSYGDLWESWESSEDCRGRPLKVGGVSANPELPLDCVVWIAGVGLRIVTDRGGKVKLWNCADGDGAFLDVYTLRPVETRTGVPWARVKR